MEAGGVVVASFLEMNNTYPSVASVALGLRFGHGGPSPRRRVLFLFATVIGQSKSKRHKKRDSQVFTGCCLLLPLIILIKLWYFGAGGERASRDAGPGKPPRRIEECGAVRSSRPDWWGCLSAAMCYALLSREQTAPKTDFKKTHQVPCQGLEGINPSNGAGDVSWSEGLSCGRITLY